MNSIVSTVLDILKKLGYLAAQYTLTLYHWVLKFFKAQLKKWKKCGAQKKIDNAYSSLGAEIYSLHKHGEANWQSMPSVQQQLKMVEETESSAFDVDAAIDEVDKEFQTKKAEIKEKYENKRAQLGADRSEE